MIKDRGFSLIELLISITIIGILTTIILTSISNSRARAYDSKIKQQLGSFRTAAELYFANNGRYNVEIGVPVASCDSGVFNNFDAINGSPGLYIADGNIPDFSQVVCGATDTAYAVKATLYSGNGYWCVDYKGASVAVSGPIGSPATICSF